MFNSFLWILYLLQHATAYLSSSPSFQEQNNGVFEVERPLSEASLPVDLVSLSEHTFTHLSHGEFPGYVVRVKKTKFCDGTVQSYTGYIDINARHLFFYFFESRNDPDTDDVIYWTNGGPGCASAAGLFMELGPCRILDEDGPKFHPESWNSNANLLAIDQPIGVGYSYADHGITVETSEEAAKDVAAFLAIFFENTKFKGRALHMTGESFGGIYIPLFASAVYDQNAKLIEAGMTPINLASIAIGNGVTDPHSGVTSLYDIQCTPAAGMPPITNIATCVRLKQMASRCEKWLKESCIDEHDDISCGSAFGICYNELTASINERKINPYDLSGVCEDTPQDGIPCYPKSSYISRYLSLPSTHTLLGVSPFLSSTNYSLASWDINQRFSTHLEHLKNTVPHVTTLLERGVRVLIYVGTRDLVCNWVGNEQWVTELEWSEHSYGLGERREWQVNGKKAGFVRDKGNLSFVTVDEAGHMVPYNKPKESLELINRWILGKNI